jgi:hypothetical protein
VDAGGQSVWTPRDTTEPGLRIAFVADPDGNLVELLSTTRKLLRPEPARDGRAPLRGHSVVTIDPHTDRAIWR